MPMTLYISKKTVKTQFLLLEALQEKIDNCDLLCEMAPTGMYIKELFSTYYAEYSTDDGMALIAFATYNDECNTYALLEPDYLTEVQFHIVESFLWDVEPHARIIVFTQKCYDEVKKHCYGKKLDVILYI